MMNDELLQFADIHQIPVDFTGNCWLMKECCLAWFRDGEVDRCGLPAIIYDNGTCCWYRNGLLHRLDGPAVVSPNGFNEWYINGERHRVDGPAIVHSGGAEWYWMDEKVEKGIGYCSGEVLLCEFHSWI